jgi:putative ABC transport system ATP-binding protein
MEITMNDTNLIKFERVTKIYQAGDIETFAINEVDLEIKRGEYVVISGPSGGGKSSILSVMGLLDKCTSGLYLFKGLDVNSLSRSELGKIRNTEMGFVFQSFNLIDSLSVYDNVALPLRYRTDISKTDKDNRVKAALENVGMDHRLKHFPTQLSGGQQQRVAVARAFVGNPSIILADEPTGNLDSKSAEVVMELLQKQFEAGVTICIVTHDPRYTTDATRSIHVFDGAITQDNPTRTAIKTSISA